MESFLCGVDIGGTKLSVGLVTEAGDLVDQLTVHDHVTKTPDLIMQQIAGLVGQLLEQNSLKQDRLRGVGVATAGHLRFRDGTLITMSNLEGFRGYPIRDKLQAHFSVPVVVDNDANAQAFAEYKFGAGRGYPDLVFLTISTQIGAGLILGGQMFRGMTGTAGEIGHTIVDPNSDLVCPCGNKGCLIAVASSVNLDKVYRRKVAGLGVQPTLGPGLIDGPFIKRGLDQGDPASQQLVAEYADYIGIALYNLFQIFNPNAIVLGGGLTAWGAPFFEGIERKFKALARDMLFDPMPILKGTVAHSGLVGAASLVSAT
ncbi:MAG: ROK family protein [Spirochaetales bacterium]